MNVKSMKEKIKIFRILLCCFIGILGSSLCILFAVTHENNYAYYELAEPSREQLQKIEEIFEVECSENFAIKSMITYQTFVPDMWQTVQITYEGNAQAFIDGIQNTDLSVSLDEENRIVVSYYDARSNALQTLIAEEGVKHSEKLVIVCIIWMLAVVVLMTLCLLPYQKIYQKLNGL